MRILIDCCLGRNWAQFLNDAGHDAVHWKSFGAFDAPDPEIIEYAESEGFVILTHDLDFGTILATQGLTGPSVVQIRAQSHLHTDVGEIVLRAITLYEADLVAGAVVSVNYARMRVHSLPLTRREDT